MKNTIISIAIFALVMASSAFADGVIGHHDLSNDRGLVRVKSVDGNKMWFDIIYAPVKGKLIVLTDIFADYDQRTRKAVYSEDQLCPDALKMTFQNNGKVVLEEAACAEF